MNGAATVTVMNMEELLALPEDGTERYLIRGELREKPMSYRNRWHSRTEARIAALLVQWSDQQPQPRGAVLSGEAGFRLRQNPDTVVGIDVAYISAARAAQDPDDTTLIDGVPILAVEILSPSDKEEDINEKVDEYLATGVALFWVIDPHFRTVTVFRPDAPPQFYNESQELTAEPHLPGFRAAVADIFSL